MSEHAAVTVDLPGAVGAPADSVDAGVAWHYGDPHAEQRALIDGAAVVDLSHRGVIRLTGADRLRWLNDLTTQLTTDLQPGTSSQALLLDPRGHVEHELRLIETADATWITVEPGTVSEVVAFLDSMRFMLRVEVSDVTDQYASIWVSQPELIADLVPDALVWNLPVEFTGSGHTEAGADRGGDAARYVPQRPATLPGSEVIIDREQLVQVLQAAPELAGTWALEALRVAAAVPRVGVDTDHKSLPHELGLIGPAVHLAKGCYRGQETVARVHNLGHPPRRLVLLHLDGSAAGLPQQGDAVTLADRQVGTIGSVARHHEWGPIALAVVKRNVDPSAELVVMAADGPMSAAQEAVVVG